jgi:hypothetical protein
MIKEGKSFPDALRTMGKMMLYHELGHLVDRATNDALTENLVFGVVTSLPSRASTSTLAKWVDKNISGYAAAAGPREAAAEAFSLVLSGRSSAALRDFTKGVIELGKSAQRVPKGMGVKAALPALDWSLLRTGPEEFTDDYPDLEHDVP